MLPNLKVQTLLRRRDEDIVAQLLSPIQGLTFGSSLKLGVWSLVISLLCGCVSNPANLLTYNPDNIHRSNPTLPANVQRLAVLPLSASSQSCDLDEGREALEPILREELIATKRFEVLQPTTETLRSYTGRTIWSASDELPPDLLEQLNKAVGCDAVLFSELTLFRPYPPIAVGWRFRLVEVHSKEVLWAADEIFDSSQASVRTGANLFGWSEAKFGGAKEERWAMLNSPRHFGQYTLATLLETLPER